MMLTELKSNYRNFTEIAKSDYFRHFGKYPKHLWLSGLFGCPNYRLTFLYRLSQATRKRSPILRVFITFLKKRLDRRYLNSLPRDTKIGSGFCAYHFNNIRISEVAEIGKNFTVGHMVTIGWINHGVRKGVPRIGDNVFIGPGAIVVGNIKIGDNVVIGGNSFVNMDVPSNSIAYGNPCIIKPQENPTEGYILNRI